MRENMERVMSVEDKIRRAEEIYYKRRQQEVPMREMMRKTPTKKNDIRLIKKMNKTNNSVYDYIWNFLSYC